MTDKPTDTRSKLIATATGLIWRNSYHAVSVDGICAQAGVKKGSFYHFFPSKSDLAMATIDEGMKEFRAIYDDIFSPARPAKERLQRMVAETIEMQEEQVTLHGCVCGCPLATLGSELASADPLINQRVREICDLKLTYYESAIRDLVAQGDLPEQTDIARKADEILALVVGQMVMARVRNDLTQLKQNLEIGLMELLGLPTELTEQSTASET